MTLHTHMLGAVVATAVITANLLPGQGYGTPEELRTKRDQKLESEFLKKADWLTDYDRALGEAENQNKLIFAYFTRSYEPSPGSSALEAGAFSEASFSDFGDQVVLLTHVTSFVVGERHARLLTDKGGRAFPTIMFLDEKGEILTVQPQDEYTVPAFRAMLDTLNQWSDLKTRAAAGDRDVANGLFLVELKLGKLTFDNARDRARRLTGFTEEQQAEIAARLLNLEFDSIMTKPGHPDGIATQLVGMKNAGQIPTGIKAQQFWTRIMTYASSELKEDADLFAEALAAMKKIWGDDERFAGRIKALERVLEELRG